MNPQTTQQENQVSPFTEDITNFLRSTFADSLGQASQLQTGLAQRMGGLVDRFSRPFDTGPQIAALREIHGQDRTDATQRIAEQFGAAGLRQGTPIAVGTGRALGDIIPAQSAQIGDILMQAFAQQGQVLPGLLGAGTNLANSIRNPLLQFAGAGAVNPAQAPSPLQQAGGFIGSVF